MKSASLRTAATELRDFIRRAAITCVHPAEGLLKYRFVTPTYAIKAGGDEDSGVSERCLTGHYLQMYDWDSCFFAQAAHLAEVDDLPLDIVANFLQLQSKEGHVPRTISQKSIWDAGDQCKPFLCSTTLFALDRQKHSSDKDKEKFLAFLAKLRNYLEYFEHHRKGSSANSHGLYHWRNVLESGVDNNLALICPREANKDEDQSADHFFDGEILAVDLAAYLYNEFVSMDKLCTMAGQPDIARTYKDKAAQLRDSVEAHMWSEKLGFYCGLEANGQTQIESLSFTGLLPVVYGLASEERTERVLAEHVLNQEAFLSPFGISSVSKREPLYNNARRGLYGRARVSNWQGPVWTLPNALVCRFLVNTKRFKDAELIASRMIQTLATDLKETGTLHENYHAEIGHGLWAPEFMSWNILALEMAELLL